MRFATKHGSVRTRVYNYYVDGATGNDSNAGTSASPWATLAKLTTVVDALAAGSSKTAYVRTGTYTDSCYFTPTNTITIRVTLAAGVTIDTTGSLTASGFGSGNTATAELRCEGAATITVSQTNGGNTPNGISAANSATVRVYGASTGTKLLVSQAADGISQHNTSHIYCENVRVENCTKGCLVPDSNSPTGTMVNCEFVAGAGNLTAGVVVWGSSGALSLTGCTITPGAGSNGNAVNFGTSHALTRCVVGSTTVRAVITTATTQTGTFTDCYFNASFDARSTWTWTRCYGKVTGRMRGTIPNVWTLRNCVLVGNATGVSSGLFHGVGNTDVGSDWENTLSVRGCVIMNYGTVYGFGFSANMITEFNLNSSATYTCHNSNTTIFAATVTGNDQTGNVTTAPALVSGTGTTQSDYCVTTASLATAGFGGGQIGFAAADIPA